MIASVLGLILFMVCMSLLTDFFKAKNRSYLTANLFTTVDVINNNMIIDIHNSRTADIQFERLDLVQAEKNISYTISANRQLLRNGVPLTPDRVKIVNFHPRLQVLSPTSAATPLVEIDLAIVDSNTQASPVQLQRNFIISLRTDKTNSHE
jgi:hypothetical protein